MNTCECEGISTEETAFLEALEKFYADYARQGPAFRQVAARYGVARNKRGLSRLGPKDFMRYIANPDSMGFAVKVGSREQVSAAAFPGDECCEWAWNPIPTAFRYDRLRPALQLQASAPETLVPVLVATSVWSMGLRRRPGIRDPDRGRTLSGKVGSGRGLSRGVASP